MLLGHRLLSNPNSKDDDTQELNPATRTGQLVYSGARLDKVSGSKTCLVLGTVDGGIGIMIPLDERTHCRLSLLQQIMSTTIKSTCGLNPREHRSIKTFHHKLEQKKNVLDGTMIWKFANLEASLQEELATAMGTSADIVLDNLSELDSMMNFF